MYKDKTIRDYLKKLSSCEPAPGGGSSAALTGAQGAALIAKVARFTLDNPKYERLKQTMGAILKHGEILIKDFLRLSEEDARVYSDVRKELKKTGDNSLYKKAALVPIETCRTSYEAIKLCLPLVREGNRNLITDTGCAAILLKGAFFAALLNVEVNLKYLKDPDFILKTGEILKPLEENVTIIEREISKEVDMELAK